MPNRRDRSSPPCGSLTTLSYIHIIIFERKSIPHLSTTVCGWTPDGSAGPCLSAAAKKEEKLSARHDRNNIVVSRNLLCGGARSAQIYSFRSFLLHRIYTRYVRIIFMWMSIHTYLSIDERERRLTFTCRMDSWTIPTSFFRVCYHHICLLSI